ncbi:MAG TPA: CpsD/CapB family tyrosine-protein kinase [Terriglobales bacterium]|jgi:capsular exopolysaccharide synthesis family protein|nr:CpsD/CapB family tyrosine-protein kinase [Terriglobales bacterium]
MDKKVFGLTHNSPATSSQMVRDLVNDAESLDELPHACFDVSPSPRLVAMTEQESVGAEKFRVLAARLQYFRKQRQLRKLVITSSIKGEGKSVISANLAITLARRQRTLLIDGDLRQSGLNVLLGSDGLAGLTEWWQDKADISDFLRRVTTVPLWYLPSGQAAGQPLEILQSQRMSEMLAQVAEWFEWVIIDSPPLVPVTDPNLWATQADGTLLVVEQGKTPKKLLQKTLESIENLKLIGVVVNASQDKGHQYYRQYHKNPGSDRATASPERQLLNQR